MIYCRYEIDVFHLKSTDTCWRINALTHWGRVTHIYVSDLTSDDGFSPGRRLDIIWTNVVLLIGPLVINCSEIWSKFKHFHLKKKMYLKMSSAEWRLFSLGLNTLTDNMIWEPAMKIVMLTAPITDYEAINGTTFHFLVISDKVMLVNNKLNWLW